MSENHAGSIYRYIEHIAQLVKLFIFSGGTRLTQMPFSGFVYLDRMIIDIF